MTNHKKCSFSFILLCKLLNSKHHLHNVIKLPDLDEELSFLNTSSEFKHENPEKNGESQNFDEWLTCCSEYKAMMANIPGGHSQPGLHDW